jgi:hypothetical protein
MAANLDQVRVVKAEEGRIGNEKIMTQSLEILKASVTLSFSGRLPPEA